MATRRDLLQGVGTIARGVTAGALAEDAASADPPPQPDCIFFRIALGDAPATNGDAGGPLADVLRGR